MENINFLVRIQCLTYNHASYIEDAMNGFTMQKTTFPYLCVIIDDASTDGEPEVIRQYLNENFDLDDALITQQDETEDFVRVFSRNKNNLNCYFLVVFLKYNHYSIKKPKGPYYKDWINGIKYIAICEGDDYWIDPLKLLKQVDFMDKHTSHSLCFCSHKNLYPSGESQIESRYNCDMDECTIEDIILGGGTFMATNSMLYRCSMYQQPYSTWAVGCPISDVPLMLTLANNGKVAFLNDVMCVYRITSSGSWTSKMRSNFKLRWNHNRKITRMWHQFDKWSGGKYHEIVSQRIWHNKKVLFKDAILSFYSKICKG